MKNILLLFIVLIFAARSQSVLAQDTLTNKNIIALTKAGMGKKLIIGAIGNSICKFNVGMNSLLELKNLKVEEDVISAMIEKSKSTSDSKSKLGSENGIANSATVNGDNNPINALPSGIYYYDAETGQYKEIESSTFSQSKSGSGLLTSMTYGLAKTKQKAVLSGSKANLQIRATSPLFYFIFDKEKKSLNESSQFIITATNPNQFVLVRLNIPSNKKSRELITGSYNLYQGGNSGVDDDQKILFKFEKLSQGVYKVYPEQTLANGEYCFLYAAGAASAGSTPIQKVFDFGIGN